MISCPHCQNTTDQVKACKTRTGSQRYKCTPCNRRYTPEPKQQGYTDAVRQQAVSMYIDGQKFRRIARSLGVDHKLVINWVNAHASQQASTTVPQDINNAELDELYTFVGQKNRIYVMTIVDRRTSCILAWAVEAERSNGCLQRLVDEASQAAYYFSDLFATYRNLIYSQGRYTPMPDKSETYRVEGDNAEMRHYI